MVFPRGRATKIATAIATATGCLAAGLLLSAAGAPPVMMWSTDGDVWLPWNTAGVVTHLQSTTGRADAAITVPAAAGHHLTVFPDGPNLLVLDADTHLLQVIEPQRLAPARAVALSSGAIVTVAPDAVYATDGPRGQVLRLDRTRLTPRGPVLDLGGPIGSTARTADGTLWAPVRTRGTVVPIRHGVPAAAIRVAPPGHAIDVVLSGDQPVVLDATAASVTPLIGRHPGRSTALARQADPTAASTAAHRLVAAGRSPTGLAGVLDPSTGRLMIADLAHSTVTSVDLPADASPPAGSSTPPAPPTLPDIDRPAGSGPTGATAAPSGTDPRASRPEATPEPARRLGAPVWQDGRIYVPDQDAGVVIVFDRQTRSFAPPVAPIPATTSAAGPDAELAVTADGDRICINDANSPPLDMICEGRLTVVSKLPAGVPAKTGATPPRPLPAAPPRPTPPPIGFAAATAVPFAAPGGPAGPSGPGRPGGAAPDGAGLSDPSGPVAHQPTALPPTTVATPAVQTTPAATVAPTALPNIPRPEPTPSAGPGTGGAQAAPAPGRR
ncbi:hypothetical protein [Frankia sp. R82]|uniref:hypothetical protein n=1 Tax=Frankia sp. R82 TaxID=2950553 RepID=UPI002043AFF5|nr:hypothetical protein [Frankia sp. R82]MCM3885612.1 hypothetical protein [Frankia sp. R82]